MALSLLSPLRDIKIARYGNFFLCHHCRDTLCSGNKLAGLGLTAQHKTWREAALSLSLPGAELYFWLFRSELVQVLKLKCKPMPFEIIPVIVQNHTLLLIIIISSQQIEPPKCYFYILILYNPVKIYFIFQKLLHFHMYVCHF